MHKKINKRSVGIQSTEFYCPEFQNQTQPARLIKKAGFRNLLEKSVTVASQASNEITESFHVPGEENSKGVQATLERDSHTFQNRRSSVRSLEIFYPVDHPSLGPLDSPRTATSELLKITERGPGSSNPGTSRMVSGVSSTLSISSQMNELYLKRHEGSLAVIYSFGDKATANSIMSNYTYLRGSQGSRRFSDETVLLIEDYQSYDQANVVRRQDANAANRASFFSCCRTENPRRSSEILTRPLPVNSDNLNELDEMVCRICHEGEEVEPLIQPCLCKGSVGCVHATCLKVWLEQSNTSRCELCDYPYAIRQNKKYTKCVSIKVFYKTVMDRRAMAYDTISFVVITPLTLVGVVMCLQASLYSSNTSALRDSSFQMGYLTKIGMIMLSGTIMVAYAVWMYTLISYHYKTWKKWYESCYDVEVIPIRMTSEERIEAARRLNEESRNRQLSAEQASAIVSFLHSPRNLSFHQRRVSVQAPTLIQQRYR